MVIKVTLEKHFEKLLQDEFAAVGAHVVRLPDDLKVAIAQGKSNKALGKEKPYDFGALFQGHYYAVECKLIKGLTFFSDQMKPHQWVGLQEAQDAGATPLLAIYFKSKAVVTSATKERKETFINKWALIDLGTEDIDFLKGVVFKWSLEDIESGEMGSYVRDQLAGPTTDLKDWLRGTFIL